MLNERQSSITDELEMRERNALMATAFSQAIGDWEFVFGSEMTPSMMQFAGHFFAAGFNAERSRYI